MTNFTLHTQALTHSHTVTHICTVISAAVCVFVCLYGVHGSLCALLLGFCGIYAFPAQFSLSFSLGKQCALLATKACQIKGNSLLYKHTHTFRTYMYGYDYMCVYIFMSRCQHEHFEFHICRATEPTALRDRERARKGGKESETEQE